VRILPDLDRVTEESNAYYAGNEEYSLVIYVYTAAKMIDYGIQEFLERLWVTLIIR